MIDFATDLPTDSTCTCCTCCTCEADRQLTADRTFEIAPDAGGGWTSWTRALTRLFTNLAARPTHCLVITQEPNQRYVQLAIGHGNVRLEASSNTYLTGDFRLMAFDSRHPVTITMFGADNPCKACK